MHTVDTLRAEIGSMHVCAAQRLLNFSYFALYMCAKNAHFCLESELLTNPGKYLFA